MTPTPTPWYAALNTSDPIIQWLINLIRAVAILAIALFVARYGKLWCVRLLTRSRVSLNLATLLGNLAQASIVTIGVISLLPSFGIDWTGLLTLVGAAGLAISLSMQDLLKNIIAGIYILIEQPFRIGDRITVKEATGIVEGVELRTTILRTEDNLNVVVPNNTIMTEVLTNRSVSDLQRQILSVTLRETRLSTISQEITTIMRSFPVVATSPAPVVALEQIQSGNARLRVEFWVPRAERVAVTTAVAQALQTQCPGASVVVI